MSVYVSGGRLRSSLPIIVLILLLTLSYYASYILLSIQLPSTQIPEYQVFLFWTTDPSTFRKRHLATLETWLYHHPNSIYNIYTKYPMQSNFSYLIQLGYNIRLRPISELLELDCHPWIKTDYTAYRYGYSHLSDYLRFCALYHYGGIYTDFDAILLRQLPPYDSFIGRDSACGKCDWCLVGDRYLAPGLMKAPKKSPILKEALKAFDNYSGEFNCCGPRAITEAYKRLKGIRVLEESEFYPFNYLESTRLFSEEFYGHLARIDSTSVHFYNHHTKNESIRERSLINEIFRKYRINSDYVAVRGDRIFINKDANISVVTGYIYHDNKLHKSLHARNDYVLKYLNTSAKDSIYVNHQLAARYFDPNRLVTVLIKTFGRMDKVFLLLSSIRKYYPGIRCIVLDDSTTIPRTVHKDRVTFINSEYDIGLSEGRNRMVALVETEYFVIIDDDFEFSYGSNLEILMQCLENADICAGKSPSDYAKYKIDYAGNFVIQGTTLYLTPTKQIEECQTVEFVPNLFMTRNKQLWWDSKLKLGEHEDFFLRYRNLTVKSCVSVEFVHKQSETNALYKKMRNRVYEYWKESLRKHGLKRMVSFGHISMDLNVPSAVKGVIKVEGSGMVLMRWDRVQFDGMLEYKVVINDKEHTTDKEFFATEISKDTKIRIYTGNGFVFSDKATTVNAKYKQFDNILSDSEWRRDLSQVHFQCDEKCYLRMNIGTGGYLSQRALAQGRNIIHVRRRTKRLIVSFKQRIERLYSEAFGEVILRIGKFQERARFGFTRDFQLVVMEVCYEGFVEDAELKLRLWVKRGSVLFDEVKVIALE